MEPNADGDAGEGSPRRDVLTWALLWLFGYGVTKSDAGRGRSRNDDIAGAVAELRLLALNPADAERVLTAMALSMAMRLQANLSPGERDAVLILLDVAECRVVDAPGASGVESTRSVPSTSRRHELGRYAGPTRQLKDKRNDVQRYFGWTLEDKAFNQRFLVPLANNLASQMLSLPLDEDSRRGNFSEQTDIQIRLKLRETTSPRANPGDIDLAGAGFVGPISATAPDLFRPYRLSSDLADGEIGPYISREAEALLDAIYTRCTELGDPRLAVVVGASKTGKTRLAVEYIARRMQQMDVLLVPPPSYGCPRPLDLVMNWAQARTGAIPETLIFFDDLGDHLKDGVRLDPAGWDPGVLIERVARMDGLTVLATARRRDVQLVKVIDPLARPSGAVCVRVGHAVEMPDEMVDSEVSEGAKRYPHLTQAELLHLPARAAAAPQIEARYLSGRDATVQESESAVVNRAITRAISDAAIISDNAFTLDRVEPIFWLWISEIAPAWASLQPGAEYLAEGVRWAAAPPTSGPWAVINRRLVGQSADGVSAAGGEAFRYSMFEPLYEALKDLHRPHTSLLSPEAEMHPSERRNVAIWLGRLSVRERQAEQDLADKYLKTAIPLLRAHANNTLTTVSFSPRAIESQTPRLDDGSRRPDLDAAAALLEQAAEAGDSAAVISFAEYLRSKGDLPTALAWLRRSASAGSWEGMLSLAQMLNHPGCADAELSEAIQSCQAALACTECPPWAAYYVHGTAMVRVAQIKDAMHSFAVGARERITAAMSNLAICLEWEGELDASLYWFLRYAEHDKAQSDLVNVIRLMLRLGENEKAEQIHQRGWQGIDVDYRVVAQAAEKAVGSHIFALGTVASKRRPSASDAQTWFRRSADYGFASGAFNAGVLAHRSGDFALAFELYERAAGSNWATDAKAMIDRAPDPDSLASVEPPVLLARPYEMEVVGLGSKDHPSCIG